MGDLVNTRNSIIINENPPQIISAAQQNDSKAESWPINSAISFGGTVSGSPILPYSTSNISIVDSDDPKRLVSQLEEWILILQETNAEEKNDLNETIAKLESQTTEQDTDDGVLDKRMERIEKALQSHIKSTLLRHP